MSIVNNNVNRYFLVKCFAPTTLPIDRFRAELLQSRIYSLKWLLFSYVVNIGYGRRWGRWPQIITSASALVAMVVSYTAFDNLWGPPLAWFVIIWVSYVYAHLAISFLLSATLATPGCEMRALPHLIAVLKNRPPIEHHCPVGPLSRIDAWEARRLKNTENKV